jgi:hypothetical protein
MPFSGVRIAPRKGDKVTIDVPDEAPEWFADMIAQTLSTQGVDAVRKGNQIECRGEVARKLSSVCQAKGYLSYEECARFVGACAEAMEFLSSRDMMFINVGLSDFMQVGKAFTLVGWGSLVPVASEELSGTIITNPFTPPELRETPPVVAATTPFYNIAAMVSTLCCQVDVAGDPLEEVDKKLGPIYHTRLYWFLMRCLELDPDDRIFLFV